MRHKLIRGFFPVLLGAAIGAAVGAIVGLAITSPYDEFRDIETFGVALLGAATGAVVTLVLVLVRLYFYKGAEKTP
jgi:hypothetical protein